MAIIVNLDGLDLGLDKTGLTLHRLTWKMGHTLRVFTAEYADSWQKEE